MIRKCVGHMFSGLFSRKKEEIKFSRAEVKRIREIVQEQLRSPGNMINIDGISLPRPGHIFRLKERTRYSLTQAGTLVFITEMTIEKGIFTDPEFKAETRVLPLNSEGRLTSTGRYPFGIRIQDLEPITDEEVIFANWKKRSPDASECFFDGEAVELAEDITLTSESMQGAMAMKLPKGLKGIVDEPELQQGRSLNDINSPYQNQRKKKTEVEIMLILYDGHKERKLKTDRFRMPLARQRDKYKIYFPTYRNHLEVVRSQIKRRLFDKEMFGRVVMDDKTRQTILSLVMGNDNVLNKWGVRSAFQKGRGEIFLAYGPPGTGKTMTGEALAELLERPLYIVDSGDFGYNPESFERGLRKIIEKTEQWNSVTLIDEAEVILRSRDAGMFDSSARVAAVLRNLEKLEKGILWLTTNRPIDIDFAVESRIRAQIYFPSFDPERRKRVWEITLPQNMPVSLDGDGYLNELAEIPINGREIRNAIINAAKRASYEKLSRVPVDYLVVAAKTIHENQEVLKQAKRDNKKDGSLGFQIEKTEES